MRILEEFWYGNIEPTEYDTSSCKEYKKLLELICKNDVGSHGRIIEYAMGLVFNLGTSPFLTSTQPVSKLVSTTSVQVA